MGMKGGFRNSELGRLPDDWRVDQLGSLNPFVTSGSRGWARYYADWGAPFVRITNLSRSSIYLDLSDLKLVKLPSDDREGMRTQLRAGDLLVSITADIGIIGYVDLRVPQPAYINQHIALVRCDPNTADTKFLAYFLASEQPQRAFRAGTDHGAKAGMNLAGVLKIRAAFPGVPEQRAIAAALSDVDALQDGLDRLIAKKRNLKQAATQQLLTGQIRLPGFSGDWIKTKVSEISDYVDGVRTPGGDVGYVEIGDIDVVRKSFSLSQKEKLSVPGAVKVPAGTLLISTVRPTRGAIAVTQSSLYVSSAFCRLRPANAILFHLVCQPTFLAHLGENSIGGTYPTCRDETILDYETLIPGDPGEQTAIAAVLSDMDAELAALEARRDKTRDLKQAMMQELLTGKTRLVPAGDSHA